MDILLTRSDLRDRGITLSNTTMLKMEAEGTLPKRRYLTPRTVVWSQAEIEEFLANLFGSEGDEAH